LLLDSGMVRCVFVGVFDGRPADYLFLLIFNWLCLVVSFLSAVDLYCLCILLMLLLLLTMQW